MKPVRIAVVGAGVMGQAHLQAAKQCPGVEISALVDPAPAAFELAARIGARHHDSLEVMLERDRPDALVLATPNHLHASHALMCIAAGLPILLEKPLATDLAEGEKILAAATASNARVLVGHHRAHSPIMAGALELINSGRLGRLVAVTGSATFLKPDHYFDDGPWRCKPGAGPILLNMIHEVHNLRILCGEIVAVQAIASNAIRGFEVEDSVAINFKFANGMLGSFMLSDTAASARSWEQTSQENPAFPSYDDEDCYVISGTQGSLSVPTMRLKTYPDAAHRSWWKPFDVKVLDLVREDPVRLQMQHFAEVARGRVEPKVSVLDGLQNLRVTTAITEAAKSGQMVPITTN